MENIIASKDIVTLQTDDLVTVRSQFGGKPILAIVDRVDSEKVSFKKANIDAWDKIYSRELEYEELEWYDVFEIVEIFLPASEQSYGEALANGNIS